MNHSRFALTTSRANLQRLTIIRWLGLAALALCIGYAWELLAMPLDYARIGWVMLAVALGNAVTAWRCRQSWPVTDPEFFIQLLLDLAAISSFLYITGGANNPFVSYYLIPLTIAAAILPWRYTLIVAMLAVSAYTVLLVYYQPLPAIMPDSHSHQGHGSNDVNLHVLGMWLNFALSAVLITFFVVKMAQALRERQDDLARAREDRLHTEQLLALATLAAGTAHELGTPLNTMSVLVEEMQQDLHTAEPAQLNEDLAILQGQLRHCKGILTRLVNTAEQHSVERFQRMPAAAFIQQTLNQWQVIRPEASWLWQAPEGEQPTLPDDYSLAQALTNLLDNAADAAASPVEIDLSWDSEWLTIAVRDRGPGIAAELAAELGKPFVSRKQQGLGIGLFLSHAAAERLGGQIRLFNHPEGGTLATLQLPVVFADGDSSHALSDC